MDTLLLTVKKWGNSYAVRLTKADLERQGCRPGQQVEVAIRPWRLPALDFTASPFVPDGDPTAGSRHDDILAGRRP